MDVINYTAQTQPIVNTVERVVTKTEQVPVLPNRPLTQAEIDMLTWQSKAVHRERIIGTVAGTVTSVATLGLVGFIVYKLYKAALESEEKDTELIQNVK